MLRDLTPKILFLLLSSVFIFSCNSYKNKTKNKGLFIYNNMPLILNNIKKINEEFEIDFSANKNVRIIKNKKNRILRNMIYTNSVTELFNTLDISEIGLEKEKDCYRQEGYSKVVLYDNDGNTSYHYYFCVHKFNYSKEFDNRLAYSVNIGQYFQTVFEK